MYKAISFILIAIVGITGASKELDSPLYNIKSVKSAFPQPNLRDDYWCFECYGDAKLSIKVLRKLIPDTNSTFDTCDRLCQALAKKTKSESIGTLCNVTCDAFGIKKFIKLIENKDLDPIWYCEVAKRCPIKDDGDAKFTICSMSPATGPPGIWFNIDLTYVTMKGTGTGEITYDIHTTNRTVIRDGFLRDATGPGTYSTRIAFKAEPDTPCNPEKQQCGPWLPGIYEVKLQYCNGKCGSKNPHVGSYDRANSTFQLTK